MRITDLRASAEIAHRAGKGFGLWFEPERVYAGTEVHTRHRDWLFPERLPAHQRSRNLTALNSQRSPRSARPRTTTIWKR